MAQAAQPSPNCSESYAEQRNKVVVDTSVAFLDIDLDRYLAQK